MPSLVVVPGTAGPGSAPLRLCEELTKLNIKGVRDPDQGVHGRVETALFDAGVVRGDHAELGREALLGVALLATKLLYAMAHRPEHGLGLAGRHAGTVRLAASRETASYTTSFAGACVRPSPPESGGARW